MPTPDLDRFQRILADFPVREAEIDEKVENPSSLRHILADVWLVDSELGHLQQKAAENGGAVTGLKIET